MLAKTYHGQGCVFLASSVRKQAELFVEVRLTARTTNLHRAWRIIIQVGMLHGSVTSLGYERE